MKVCCGNGKPYDSLTEAERLGGCGNDHCVGPIIVEDFDLLLTGLGTFNTNDCTNSDELCKLLKTKCQECKDGEMKELSIYDDWEGMLTCDKCGKRSEKC